MKARSDGPKSSSSGTILSHEQELWESSLRDYNPNRKRTEGIRRKGPIMSSRPPLNNKISEKVLQSLVAQAEDEVDSMKDYCQQVVADQVHELQMQFMNLETTMTARIAVVEDSVSNLEKQMEAFRIDRLNSPTSVANLFSSGHMNLENVLLKIEDLIAGLLNDMGRQGKELSSWRNKFREIGLEIPSDDDEDGSYAPMENLFHKVSRLESKITKVEREQRELNTLQHSNTLRNKEQEEYEIARNKDRQQLEGKISILSSQMTELNTQLNDLQQKSVSEDVLMHTHVRLVEQMTNDHTSLKKKIKTLGMNTSKAVRVLEEGLQDVQGTSVNLLNYCEKVQVALQSSNALPSDVLPEYQSSRTQFSTKGTSKWQWDIDSEDDT